MKINMAEKKLFNYYSLAVNGEPFPEGHLDINTGYNCMCEPPELWSKRKGEKEMNEFLEIKKNDELKKNDEEYELKKEIILKDDKIQKILKDAENEINEIYKAEGQTRRIDLYKEWYSTKENHKKIEELKKEFSEKEDKIVDKYREIEALVEDIPAKDRVEIYKMYNII